MDPHSTTLRDAEPTREDGLAFARYLDTAAEGFFGFMLGRRAMEILARAFVEPGHDLSHENVIFANRGGVIVGMAAGYTAEQHRRSSRKALNRAAGRHHVRMRIVKLLFAPLMRIIDTISDGEFYLLAVAVDETARGGRVGSLLMDAIEQRARASGSTRLSLDVGARNEAARRFYERRGMTVESRWPRRLQIPALTFHRMTLTL